MNEQEWSELEPNEQDVELNLDDIMKEFAADEERDIQETSAQEILEAALSEAGVRLDEEPETLEEDDTVLFERPEKKDDTVDYAPAEEWDDTISFDPVEVSGDTLSFDPVEDGAEAADDEEELGDTLQFGKDDMEAIRQAAERGSIWSRGSCNNSRIYRYSRKYWYTNNCSKRFYWRSALDTKWSNT